MNEERKSPTMELTDGMSDDQIPLPNAWQEYEGEKLFLSEYAWARLWLDGQLFINEKMFVICNDIFAWGLADLEPITDTWETSPELQELYDFHMADTRWGTTKWCMKKRNMRPQAPVEKDMRKDGAWEDWMDNLGENLYDKARREGRGPCEAIGEVIQATSGVDE